MKNWIYKLFAASAAIVLIFGCEPNIDVPAPSSGGADFSNYIAVGNSLTAGYADGGLYDDAQMQSYPAIIAGQINKISPITFTQPDIPGNGSGYIFLSSLAPDLGIALPDGDWLNQLEGPFNNLGVPGIRVKDISVAGYGSTQNANAYFYRMLGGKDANSTYLSVVAESAPTFFTCWMGNNDVLGYASSGGAFGIGGLPGTGLNGLTDKAEFASLYTSLINAFGSNARGVVVTLPDITLAPFFTQVPWNGAVLDADTAAIANASYAARIDPQVEALVQEGIIELTVTETALSANVVPTVAQGAVYQQAYDQAYQQAIDGGATPDQAKAIADDAATDFVASAEGQATIGALEGQLNAELQNHLLGQHDGHTELEPLYAVMDQELATNTELQAGIAQGITDLTTAYEAGALPPEQQAALEGAISQQTAAQIAQLKAAGFYPVFQEGPNAFVIQEESPGNPLGIRQMVEGEYILLSAQLDGKLEGTAALEPKEDQYILTLAEVANIREYTDAYNQIIREKASENIGLVEIGDVLTEVNNGIFQDGVSVNGDFITGGAFSLDGVHLTPRGYAIAANAIIEEINGKFNARITPAIINNHRAVVLP
jgi:hypothetical protein